MEVKSLLDLDDDVELVLISGVPGSGKSTLAEAMRGFMHVEGDMFFINRHGDYEFNYDEVEDAMDWCEKEVIGVLMHGDKVVVSNTFMTPEERKPYFDMARDLGKKAVIFQASGNFKNTHNIPDVAVDKMKSDYIPFDESEYEFDEPARKNKLAI